MLYTFFITLIISCSTVSAKVKGDESFNVYINLPHNLSLSTCEETKGHRCIQYRVPACITFQGPSYLLPTTL